MEKVQIGRRSMLQAAAGIAVLPAFAEENPPSSIVDVGGIRVGHHTDSRRPTGCSVVIFENGAVAGVDVRGEEPVPR